MQVKKLTKDLDLVKSVMRGESDCHLPKFVIVLIRTPSFADSYDPRVQNNFQTVAGHGDWPKKFSFGQALFLTDQNIGKKLSWC